jgi:hypothetical protein
LEETIENIKEEAIEIKHKVEEKIEEVKEKFTKETSGSKSDEDSSISEEE